MARFLILGKGRSGEAAAAVLRAEGHEIDFAEGYQGVVVSPGVPVKSELQLGCEELKRRGWKLLAVTGSKGKSSVVKIVADAIALSGRKAVPCGNYGRPVCDLIGEEPGWAVVEVSSFQLETTTLPSDFFAASAVLNVQEDHLDRHGSVSAYWSLKHRLSGMARVSFAGWESQSDDIANGPAAGARPLLAGSYFDNPILSSNGTYAVALMRVAGVDDATIARAFREFQPLPHRMNLVGTLGGVRYIDDSKATSLAALAAGVAMASAARPEERTIRLVAGGLPKGDDPKSVLSVLTKWVKKVYLIGQCAKCFQEAWSSSVECEFCETMARAVASAKREAESGDTVLLSPGTASFDQFKSFGERGEVFARLVKKEGQTE